jgi:two-component system C4-dicarboxylate transport sensor histidine kinase DctB
MTSVQTHIGDSAPQMPEQVEDWQVEDWQVQDWQAKGEDSRDTSLLSAPLAAPMIAHWQVRLAFVGLALVGLTILLITNNLLTQRFSETTRNRAELRLALYSGNILGDLQRSSVVPLLLSGDPTLVTALKDRNFTATTRRLIAVQREIGVASIMLLDSDGRVVGATDRNILGSNLRAAPYFVAAQRSNDTVFTAAPRDGGAVDFTYARHVAFDGRNVGVVVVAADLMKHERSWASLQDTVLVTDSQGTVVLASNPRWRGKAVDAALTSSDGAGAIARALARATDWAQDPPDAYLSGEAVMRTEARVPFQGWRMVNFTAYDSVRTQVNGVIALQMMGMAILAAVLFYMASRRAQSQSVVALRESAELRKLNARLNTEIAKREKVQKTLEVAETSLEQSSKLAALGEMSAAVSHELNQPLAAMKTYLAGARLLLERKRPDEALSSFQRIDDLIDRMGAITRQLKSYARKGGDAVEPVDLRACLSSALSMMEPQLKTRALRIARTVPRAPVMVMADRLRLEQVIINLLRNAIDATKGVFDPGVELLITKGKEAVLSVRDNGAGIKDPSQIFEPFYTTKKQGEGVGLGLAISSGIMADLGGRLTARNAPEGAGAIFDITLPLIGTSAKAAE